MKRWWAGLLVVCACDGDDERGSVTKPSESLLAVDPSAVLATPVLLGDVLLVTAANGVTRADGTAASIAPTGAVVEPLVAARAASGASLFAVVEGNSGGQRIEAFTAAGGSAWQLEVGGVMRRPAERGERMMIVASEADGIWHARWVDRQSGAVLADHPLGAGPATAPARLRSLDSDWLVGVGARVVALSVRATNPPTIEEIASVDTEGVTVTSVFTTGAWLWGAVGWSAGHAASGATGLGDRLIAGGWSEAGPTGTTLGLIGHPIATPGVVEAPPIIGRAVPVCNTGGCTRRIEGVLASGGSHWLGVWRADTAEPIGVVIDLPERVTGLTIASNGEIMSGGSHWHPGLAETGLVVRGHAVEDAAPLSLREVFQRELAEDAFVVGVPSPVVRAGELAVMALTSEGPRLFTVARAGVAPAVCGWTRAFGDAQNSGSHVMESVDACAPTP